MPAFLGALDCLVLPSVNSTESFGLVQVEAMLCGTPVVASDLPGVRTVVRATGMGEIAGPGDGAGLAEAIRRVLEQRESYVRPRSAIEREYAVGTTVRRYVSLFERLSGKKADRPLGGGNLTVAAIARRCLYRALTLAPAGAVGRARTAGRVAPLLEAVQSFVGAPLYGHAVPVARGPGAGLMIVAERRSLAWLSGRVEPEVQRVLVERVRPGATFVDVGASIGFFTLLAGSLVGPEGSVVAFEPQRDAASSLRRNAALNGFAMVEVVEAAVGARTGEASLRGLGKATAHIVDDGEAEVEALRVRATTLDDHFTESLGPPVIVKIDVEGRERDVLARHDEAPRGDVPPPRRRDPRHRRRRPHRPRSPPLCDDPARQVASPVHPDAVVTSTRSGACSARTATDPWSRAGPTGGGERTSPTSRRGNRRRSRQPTSRAGGTGGPGSRGDREQVTAVDLGDDEGVAGRSELGLAHVRVRDRQVPQIPGQGQPVPRPSTSSRRCRPRCESMQRSSAKIRSRTGGTSTDV